MKNNPVVPRYSARIDVVEIQSERFCYELAEPMNIVAQTASSSIVLLRQGSLAIRSGRRTVRAEEGDIIFFPKGIFYNAMWEGAPFLDFYSIHFKKAMNAVNSSPKCLQRVPGLRQKTERYFSEIHGLLSEKSDATEPADGCKAVGLFYLLCSELSGRLEADNDLYPDVLVAAMRYMERNYRDNFGISSLSEECFVSESRIYYLFRHYLDTTPVRYRNELRVAEASKLLTSSKLTIEEVSERCGFNSSNYFRTIFQSLTGLPPSKFREHGNLLGF